MVETIIPEKRKRGEPLQVWLCIACMRYAEFPGNCSFCGTVILSKPIRIEIAVLQKLTDLVFVTQKLLDKTR